MGYISGPLDPSFYLFLVVMMVRRVSLLRACTFCNFPSCARRLLVLYRPTCESNKDALETILYVRQNCRQFHILVKIHMFRPNTYKLSIFMHILCNTIT